MANEIPLINRARGADRIVRDIGNKIEGVLNQLNTLASRAEGALGRTVKGIRDVGNAADRSARQISSASSGFSSWASSADRLGKSLASFDLNIISRGINLLITGIQRVYELKERWARITGELNMKIGGLSANMRQAQRFMANWEGRVRSLTDQFGQGAAMAGEFLETMETMNRTVMKSSQVMGLVLARGFNLGGRAAGELLKSFRAMHTTGTDVAVDFANMAVLANKFEVPLNAVAKDIAEASDFMLQFGEDGKRSFLQGAVYLKQFNVSLKDMQRFMSAFDTLDDASQTVSKLNMTFGTTLSSLDMMMTQDPAERFEMVRQQMLSQGKTYDTMSRAQRMILSQTLQLSEKEVAFMLDREKAHLSLSKFREEASKDEVNEQRAQKMMQKQLRATSQTLYAFGAAFDRITMAIAKALRPLLEMLGLVKSGDKEWKSFGNVMESFTQTFVRLFEGLAKSPQWIAFLQKLADKIKAVMKWVTGLTTSDFTNFFETAITWGKRFLVVSGALIALWAGGKALKAISNIGTIAGAAFRGVGKLSSTAGAATAGLGRVGKGAVGAGLGLATAQLTGGGTMGGNIGGAVGGALGMLGGPIGAAIGGAVGGWLGKHGQKFFENIDKGAKPISYMATLQKRANKLMEENERLEIVKSSMDQAILIERKREIDALKESHGTRRQLAALEKEQLKRDAAAKAAGRVAGKESVEQMAKQLEARGAFQKADVDLARSQAMLGARNDPKLLKLLTGGSPQDLERAVQVAREQTIAAEKNFAVGSKERKAAVEQEKNIIKLNNATVKMALFENKSLMVKRAILNTEILQSQLRSMENKDLAEAIAGIKEGGNLADLYSQERFQGNKLLAALISNRGEINSLSYQLTTEKSIGPSMASGGIVTRPTRALIGEAGAEAVIPLKAMARGKVRNPEKFGGQTARRLVNYASRGTEAGHGEVRLVAGDVYLDGAKVGRHIVRDILENTSR